MEKTNEYQVKAVMPSSSDPKELGRPARGTDDAQAVKWFNEFVRNEFAVQLDSGEWSFSLVKNKTEVIAKIPPC